MYSSSSLQPIVGLCSKPSLNGRKRLHNEGAGMQGDLWLGVMQLSMLANQPQSLGEKWEGGERTVWAQEA